MRGAPERLDAVDRRAVADDGDDRPLRQRHPHAGRAAEREAEPAHRGAQEAERLARGQPVVQLGPVDGRLLDDDRIARQPLGERREHVTGAQRLARRRRLGRRRRPKRLGRRDVARRHARIASSRQTAAGGASTASSAGLRCTSSALSLTTRDPRAGVRERPGAYGRLPEDRRADDEHGVVRRELLAQPRPVGRQEARRTADGPAGSRRARRTTPGTPARRAAPRARRAPPTSRRRPRPRRRRTRATRASARNAASASTAAGSTAAARSTRRPRRPRARPRPARSSRPSARSRAPARDASRPRGTRARSRRAPPAAAPAARPTPGSRRRDRRACPARNGSNARCRRSCWPTSTTSGARFTRAVASAPTALPSPAVVCTIASAGSPRADRVAGRERDDRVLVQREHEAQVVRQPREERHLRRAGIREQRRQPAPAEDVERRVADGAVRQPQTSCATSTIRRSFAHCSSSREHVALDRRREAALRREAQLLERRVPRRLLDAPLQLVLRLELAALRRHEPEHDLLLALRQEAQRLEAARALVVPLHEEAVDVELVEQRLGDEVVAALRRPRRLEVAAARCASSRSSPAGRPASASLMWRMYSTCWRSGSPPIDAMYSRWCGSFMYARLVSSNWRYVQPSSPSRRTSSRYAATRSAQNASSSG